MERVAPCRLYFEKTQTRVVLEGPDAAFLFRGAGQHISEAEWKAHGLDKLLDLKSEADEEAALEAELLAEEAAARKEPAPAGEPEDLTPPDESDIEEPAPAGEEN